MDYPWKVLGRQRCPNCGSWLNPINEGNQQVQMPATLCGYPVFVLCGKCCPLNIEGVSGGLPLSE